MSNFVDWNYIVNDVDAKEVKFVSVLLNPKQKFIYRSDPIKEPDREYRGAEHPIWESDQDYKVGEALQVKYSEYFGAKKVRVI
jgi:hypothetical protein